MQQFRLQEEVEMREVEQAALESNPNEISSSNMNLEKSKDSASIQEFQPSDKSNLNVKVKYVMQLLIWNV